jgi:hypothetical protein
MRSSAPDASPPWNTQPLGLVALRWLSGKLQRVARYRLVRRQWSRFKRRFLANGLVLTYRVERHVRVFAKRLFADLFQHLATVLGVMIAGAFVLAADDTFFQSATFSAANFHLASAGIMGTALALVLSLSIVPVLKRRLTFSHRRYCNSTPRTECCGECLHGSRPSHLRPSS